MIRVCIYKKNRGLGACEGPVTKIKVANKATLAWRGLHELAERLKPIGEEPGVCKAHEKRGEENGYLLDEETATSAQPAMPRKRSLKPAPSADKTVI